MKRELNQLLLPQQLGLNLFLALGFIGGATGWRISVWTGLWIVVGFVAFRNAGHAFNQIVDLRYDAQNPRTRDRPLVTGRLSIGAAKLVVLANIVILFVAAYLLNFLVLLLAPVALALVLGYSYTKRYTAWTTVLLGMVEAMIPVGIYLATQQALNLPALVGGFAVLSFGTGFETVHSLGDIASDRELGLHSIPTFLGREGGIAAAAAFFSVSLGLFGIYGAVLGLGGLYLVGLIGMGAALAWEIRALSKKGLPISKVFWANFAFGMFFLLGILFGQVHLPGWPAP